MTLQNHVAVFIVDGHWNCSGFVTASIDAANTGGIAVVNTATLVAAPRRSIADVAEGIWVHQLSPTSSTTTISTTSTLTRCRHRIACSGTRSIGHAVGTWLDIESAAIIAATKLTAIRLGQRRLVRWCHVDVHQHGMSTASAPSIFLSIGHAIGTITIAANDQRRVVVIPMGSFIHFHSLFLCIGITVLILFCALRIDVVALGSWSMAATNAESTAYSGC